MKAQATLLVTLLSLSAIASSGDYRTTIANDLDSLFGDTVNEGNRIAEVVKDENGNPGVTCTMKAKTDSINVAMCKVNVMVTVDDCDLPPSITTCYVHYEMKGKDASSLRRGNPGLIEGCIENVDSVDCR